MTDKNEVSWFVYSPAKSTKDLYFKLPFTPITWQGYGITATYLATCIALFIHFITASGPDASPKLLFFFLGSITITTILFMIIAVKKSRKN